MEKGIICFETGEFAKYSTGNQFVALPLLAYFHQIFLYSTVSTYKKHMADYQQQLNKLGFTIV